MKSPLISIITPSFNQGQFIEETILSVLSQSYKNIEYIIIDGGSTDSTMQIVDKYRDRIDIVIHEKDNGQSDAINKGFKLAKGRLIGWINSDDILYRNCIEDIVGLYNKFPDGSIYYNSWNDLIDKDSNVLKTYNKRILGKDFLLNQSYSVIQQGSFYNRELVETVGYLDESCHYCMDLDLWLRLLDLGPIYRIDNGVSTSGFRWYEDSKTGTGGKKFFQNILNVLQKYGAEKTSPNVIRLKWYMFKEDLKTLLKK